MGLKVLGVSLGRFVESESASELPGKSMIQASVSAAHASNRRKIVNLVLRVPVFFCLCLSFVITRRVTPGAKNRQAVSTGDSLVEAIKTESGNYLVITVRAHS